LTAGQTAGGITEILTVDQIMRRLIAEAEAAPARMRWRGESAQQPRPQLMPEPSPSLTALQEVPEPDSLGG
jgi:hypothetical protein